MLPAHANPFRSERVVALPWRVPGLDLDRLWSRLEAIGGRAAIVGPHGSGKTTLLEALVGDAPRRGLRPRLLRLPDGPRRASARALATAAAAGRECLLAVDGGERLSPAGCRLIATAGRRAAALVVTAHRPGRLPTLLETRTSPELLLNLVGELAPEELPFLVPTLPELWRRHAGNLRACFGELYDRAAGRRGTEPQRGLCPQSK